MRSQHIQIGIDLGTTNSTLAVNINNGEIEVIRNKEGDEFTPSLFGFDQHNNPVIGKQVNDLINGDPTLTIFNNSKSEIKRLIGSVDKVHFEHSQVELSAEEISAAIIKNLVADTLKKYPELNTQAAVITVPAHFSTLQSEATKRAGILAGFQYVVLLQEPIAAAISYGFMNKQNENWLIYDLGGGTFDVALISSRDGTLSVLSHNGDNFLGGKDIDWLIIDQIFVPKILEKYKLNQFNRSNVEHKQKLLRLKNIAELAKIQLSYSEKIMVRIDKLGCDANDNEINLEFELTRQAVDTIIIPFLQKTIAMTQETLNDAYVAKTAVNKIILVGAATKMPIVKTFLEHALSITVDNSADPITSVARGACIFALSQKIPTQLLTNNNVEKNSHHSYQLKLNYESLTAETEEVVTGYIPELQDSLQPFKMLIQSEHGNYTSEKFMLKKGKFIESVSVMPNKQNLFWIYLFNAENVLVPIQPDSFMITHGLSISGALIPSSIGVTLLKTEVDAKLTTTEIVERIFEKGASLPLKKTVKFKTVMELKKGENSSLWIKISEGESTNPDGNTYICEVGIKGKDLPQDLPANTDIELTIFINDSRELFVTAYIQLIDATINARSTFKDKRVDVMEIESLLQKNLEKFNSIKNQCSAEERQQVNQLVQSVVAGIKNSYVDEDEKQKTNKEVKALTNKLDELEQGKAMPMLEDDLNAVIENTQRVIDAPDYQKDKVKNQKMLETMRAEAIKAIAGNDKKLLIRVIAQISDLKNQIVLTNPSTWIDCFNDISQDPTNFTDQAAAEKLIDEGNKALKNKDMNGLQRSVQSLSPLLTGTDKTKIIKKLSGIKW